MRRFYGELLDHIFTKSLTHYFSRHLFSNCKIFANNWDNMGNCYKFTIVPADYFTVILLEGVRICRGAFSGADILMIFSTKIKPQDSDTSCARRSTYTTNQVQHSNFHVGINVNPANLHPLYFILLRFGPS